jgi:hypothetical protein
MRPILIAAVTIGFATVGYGQKVVQPWDNSCSNEIVKPNLELRTKRHVIGTVKDRSGAPFVQSRVLIQRFREKEKSTMFKEVVTDDQGRFDFGLVSSGKHRFLPSPTRAFQQPSQVSCSEGELYELNLILEVNPSDQAFINCPVQ